MLELLHRRIKDEENAKARYGKSYSLGCTPDGLLIHCIYWVVVSLNSLSGAEPLSKILSGLAIQLLPALAVLLVLLVYWRNTFYSGIAFMIVSVAFTVFFKTYTNIYSFLFLSITLAIIALLLIGAEAAAKNPT